MTGGGELIGAGAILVGLIAVLNWTGSTARLKKVEEDKQDKSWCVQMHNKLDERHATIMNTLVEVKDIQKDMTKKLDLIITGTGWRLEDK